MKKFNLFLSLIAITIISSLFYSYISNNDINKVNIFGYIINYVQSGSMSPEIETYDLVLSKRINFEDVKVGDIITYECNYEQTEDGDVIESNKTTLVIHRVIEKNKDYLITKGDANKVKDPWKVLPNNVVSKSVYILKNPFE